VDDSVELGSNDGELHVIGDAWTLVIIGDPVTDAYLAVDNEDGDPEAILEAAISDDELAAMRDADSALGGTLISALTASPDRLSQMLARVLEG
jgi:hypothetical protein